MGASLTRRRFARVLCQENLTGISHNAYYVTMRMTLSIPDAVAHRFQVAVPPRERSRLVTHLLEGVLSKHEDSLAAACRAANRDRALEREVEDWQSFEDGVAE
jgi:hypothetical protein